MYDRLLQEFAYAENRHFRHVQHGRRKNATDGTVVADGKCPTPHISGGGITGTGEASEPGGGGGRGPAAFPGARLSPRHAQPLLRIVSLRTGEERLMAE